MLWTGVMPVVASYFADAWSSLACVLGLMPVQETLAIMKAKMARKMIRLRGRVLFLMAFLSGCQCRHACARMIREAGACRR